MNAVVLIFMLLCETWIFGCQSEIIVPDIAAILLRLENVEKKVESLEVENKRLKDALEKCRNIPNSDSFKPEQNQKLQAATNEKTKNGNEAANRLSKTQNNTDKRLLLGTTESTISGVAFRASLSKYISYLGSHQIIEYDRVPLNIGNAYDSHGHFTAPVKGIYIIYVSVFANPGQEAILSLVHNGVQIDVLHADGRPAHYNSMTKVYPLMMNQGDMVWLMTYPGTEGKQLYGSPLTEHNMFAGVLLLAL